MLPKYIFDFFNHQRIADLNQFNINLLAENERLQKENESLLIDKTISNEECLALKSKVEKLTLESEKLATALTTLGLIDKYSETIKLELQKIRAVLATQLDGDNCKDGICPVPPRPEFFPPAE